MMNDLSTHRPPMPGRHKAWSAFLLQVRPVTPGPAAPTETCLAGSAADPRAGAGGTHIAMPVTWHLTDTDLDVFFDGGHIGCGSVNKGIDLKANTTARSHVLELGADVMAVGGTPLSWFSTRGFGKTWRLPFGVSGAGERTARLKYSRAWGNFKISVE